VALRDKYDVLRTDHQAALDALNAHMEHASQQTQDAGTVDRTQDAGTVEQKPTRPEGHYSRLARWSGEGGMVQQQASANEWVRANHEQRSEMSDLNQHIERSEAGQAPDKTPDIGRVPENDIER
jgi:hypothetical protein